MKNLNNSSVFQNETMKRFWEGEGGGSRREVQGVKI